MITASATSKLISDDGRRWAAMHIDPARKAEFGAVAKRLIAPAAKAIYLKIEARTGIPWYVIAVIHEREAGQRWDRNIAQGDPWNAKSTHVPAKRGPFKSFEDAAYDALTNCAPYAARWKNWTIGGVLALLEQYNGLGYFLKGMASPYDFSGTDQYVEGKYVADHKFDLHAVDRQLGCAALLACMAELDSSIHFDVGTAPAPASPVSTTPPAQRDPSTRVKPASPAKKAGAVVVIASTTTAAAAAAPNLWPYLLAGAVAAVIFIIVFLMLRKKS